MKRTRKKIYSTSDYKSPSGMLTRVWGPSLWFFLHTISFNYPVHPTKEQKKHYRNFISNIQYILPCRYCRENLKKNLKKLPLRQKDLKNRDTFSRWMYHLHELVNKMLHKKSGLKYNAVRERYEHFRARCTEKKKKKCIKVKKRKTRKKENGCVVPLYGKKSKCVIQIVPQEKKCKTIQIDKKCIKSR